MNEPTETAAMAGAVALVGFFAATMAIWAMHSMDTTRASAAAGPLAALPAILLVMFGLCVGFPARTSPATAVKVALALMAGATTLICAPAYVATAGLTGLPVNPTAIASMVASVAVLAAPAALLHAKYR